ncbi:hypothetical protein DdX_15537 [Ditylenchus destructor]|uniref:Uncharacterized protein n=1 Tax=Ditylenchus destructor TaxID=166010 RepID=A0AAD4MUU7_9BILA|nr:hypothetical protein DdX_15537 [Ditylenchus destructor]
MDDSKQYRCCCNSMHVQRGAQIIGIVGALVCAFGLIVSAVLLRWDLVISNLLNLLLYASIIYGHMKQRPSFYWPFLILNGIGVALVTVLILITGVTLGLSVAAAQKPADQEQANKGGRLGGVFLLAVLLICLFLGVWCQCVVYRAYKYLKMNESSIPTTYVKREIQKQDA